MLLYDATTMIHLIPAPDTKTYDEVYELIWSYEPGGLVLILPRYERHSRTNSAQMFIHNHNK